MTRNVHTYEHFCVVARALERVGDRWSLLVIRDLLAGRRRFTDLMARLGGITPKTLTQRLRELQDADLVTADRTPGRREVWYRLTPAGTDLGPVIETLTWWGLRHAWRLPRPGEPLHPEHLLRSVMLAVTNTTDDHRPARWLFRLPDQDYLMAGDGEHWSLTTTGDAADPDVTVTATADTLGRYLLDPASAAEVTVTGDAAAVRRFRRLVGGFAATVRES